MYRVINHFSRSSPLKKFELLNKEANHGHLAKLDKKHFVFLSAASKIPTKRDTRISQANKSLHIKPEALSIRYFREADIKPFIQMTKKQGWDNTEFDCYAALKLDPTSIIVAADDSDTPLGFVGVHEMFNKTLYSGQFIVKETVRGNGIGRKLLAAAWDRIGETNVCIDAAENLIEYYGKQGFVHELFRTIIHKGLVSPECKRFKTNTHECEIVLLTDDIWPDLLKYDRNVYKGISREKILRLWFVGKYVYTIVAFCNGKVSGYGSFVKAGNDEYYIKTVFGDDANVVEEILDHMLDQIPIGANLSFVLMADKIISERFTGFESTLVTHRLSTKFKIETECDKMFYICYQFV